MTTSPLVRTIGARERTAMMAVENMLGAQHDLWAVNTDFEYHEEQKIEPAAKG